MEEVRGGPLSIADVIGGYPCWGALPYFAYGFRAARVRWRRVVNPPRDPDDALDPACLVVVFCQGRPEIKIGLSLWCVGINNGYLQMQEKDTYAGLRTKNRWSN